MDRRTSARTVLALAAGAALSVGCTGAGAQVTESNANHPARGFGSFEEPQNDTVERTGRAGREY